MTTTITADMVLAVTPVKPATAERIAAYLTHRYAGMRPTDARREVGIGNTTGGIWERLLPAVLDRHDLPHLPEREPWTDQPDYGQASQSGTHQRWHLARGEVDPACPFCSTGEDA